MLRNFYKMKTKYTISKWHFVNNDKRPLLCFFVFIPVLKFPLFHLGNFKNFKSDLKNIIPNFPHNDVTKVFFTLEGKVNLKVVSMVRIFIFKMVGYQHWRRKKNRMIEYCWISLQTWIKKYGSRNLITTMECKSYY